MSYRVIHWAPGLVGKMALQGTLDRPDLELVGLWVHSPRNAGKDAGSFCGRPDTGVISTTDVDEVLAIDADCVVYTATDLRREPKEIAEDIARMLRSGKNVVGVQASMNHLAVHGPEIAEIIEDAAREGGTSYYPTGINANGSQTVLATLATMCQRVESTYLCEMYNFTTYEDPEVFGYFGYGLTPEAMESHDMRPLWEYLFGPALHLTGHWFGVEFDEVRWQQDYAVSRRDVTAPLFSLEAGTVSAIRFNLDGYVDGKCRVTQGGAYWVGDYPAHWEDPPGEGGYRLAIVGEPSYQINWATRTGAESYAGPLDSPRDAEGLAIMGGLKATAARAVNSVPALCQAAPGLVMLGDQTPLLPPVDWRDGGPGDDNGAVFAGARDKGHLGLPGGGPVVSATGAPATHPSYLSPADELPHPIEHSALWSENYLSGAVFPDSGTAVWLHQSRIPEDPEIWEEIFIFYLPGDRLLVAKGAAAARRPDEPGGAALTYTCVEPFQQWTKQFHGTARMVTGTEHLAVPVLDGPSVPVHMRLTWRAAGNAYDMDVTEQPWATTSSHYQQHMQVTGTIDYGDEHIELEGPGMRDHSWGARDLGELGTHIWTYGAFPSGLAFMAFYHVCEDGSRLLDTAHLFHRGEEEGVRLASPPALITRADQATAPYGVTFTRPDGSQVSIEAQPQRAAVMGFANHAELVIGGPHAGSSHAIYECPTRFTCDGELGWGNTERTITWRT